MKLKVLVNHYYEDQLRKVGQEYNADKVFAAIVLRKKLVSEVKTKRQSKAKKDEGKS